MSEEDHNNLIAQFQDVTGVDEGRAKFYLEAAEWDIGVATSSFFEGNNERSDSVEHLSPQSVQSIHSDSDEHDGAPPYIVNYPGPVKPKKEKKPKKTSKFGTISGLKQQEDEDEESDDDKGQAFYAGGSIHSGQQVIGPSKKKKDFVADMFKSVQAQGQDILVDPSTSRNTQGGSAFTGSGYRLGETADEPMSPVVQPSTSNQSDKKVEVTLKLWKEGFSINDGELKSFTEPENIEFLNNIKKGIIPPELLKETRGGEIHLSMVDHRFDTYVPPKQKLKSFAGQGQMLGSPTPTAVGQTKVLDEKDRVANENAAKSAINVNSSEPTTNLQIRLADGSRLIGTFNHSHTVADVRTFINLSRPQYESINYDLLTTFPSKVLSDTSASLKDSGLLNAVIQQKAK